MGMPTALFLSNDARKHVTGKVLDVGCGSKPYKAMFPDCEWTGLDIRDVGDVKADAHSIPFPDAEFDTVLCTEMLHVCLSPVVVVREMARVLKPGGYAVISAPANIPDDGETLWCLKVRGLDYLIQQAGLKPEHLGADGRTWTQEWKDHANYMKYGVVMLSSMDGWLSDMDMRYPTVSFCIAQKERTEGVG